MVFKSYKEKQMGKIQGTATNPNVCNGYVDADHWLSLNDRYTTKTSRSPTLPERQELAETGRPENKNLLIASVCF